MSTRNARIFGLGVALATLLTLGVALRAPGGLVAVGDDEASGIQGGAQTGTGSSTATCGTVTLTGGNGCGVPNVCPSHTSYTVDNYQGSQGASNCIDCSSTVNCGQWINSTCN
jgi:hypothetical protein